jgi:hypothetical protein
LEILATIARDLDAENVASVVALQPFAQGDAVTVRILDLDESGILVARMRAVENDVDVSHAR